MALIASGIDQYIIGVPQNNGSFFDGTRYWLFYMESGTLKCQYGTDLSSMSDAGSTGISTVPNAGRQYSILFGSIGATQYAWCLYDDGTEHYGVKRWELTSSGLGTASNQNAAIGDKSAAHCTIIHDYGSEQVVDLLGSMNGPTTDSNPAFRQTSADMTSGTGMSAWNPTDIIFPEHTLNAKLSDGYVSIMIDEGNSGEQNGNFGHLKERTKTLIGDAWSSETTVEGNVSGASVNDGDFTDQNYGVSTSHAGQQDKCQLDSGDIYFAYCANDDLTNGNYGKIKLVHRGNTKASGWTLISNDVINTGNAWHVTLSTDGTDIWIFYCKDNGGSRDSAIYYRKYDVSETTFSDEFKVADMQDGFTFNRMFSQWRSNGNVTLAWSETNGTTYNAYMEHIFVSNLQLTVSGIPNGSYMTVLDKADGTRIQRQNETYSSEVLDITLPVDVGTTVKGYVDDANNPSANGAYLEGVTA